LAKHINRVTKDGGLTKIDTTSSEDEWSHITELGPKIEIQDPLEVKDRTIFFSSKEQAQTRQEIVQEKAQDLKDQLNNTNQYQKFVNTVLKERVGDLKKMLDQERRFTEELNCFQNSPKTRQDLEKVNSKYISEAETKSLITTLELEYQKMREKLDYELSKIEKTKSELEAKRQQIAQLKEEFVFIAKKEKKDDVLNDPILTIKHELKKLGISDESGKINEALRLLSSKMNQTNINNKF
jgi:hypothetical protein